MNDRPSELSFAPIVLAHRQPFRIGGVAVRPATRELIGPDSREVVEPRIMQVLVALHDARGEIVSRDDLTLCCWDGRVVGDDAINRVISRIRRLGETIGGGGFGIETITKVGYRLTAQGWPGPETAAAAPAEPPAAEANARPGPSRPGIGRRSLIGGAAALALAGGAGTYWFRGSDRSGLDDVPAEVREDFARGHAFIKDGRYDEASAAFQRVTDARPDFADGWGWLALALEGQRFLQPVQAADLLETRSQAASDRALALDPRNPHALAARAVAIPEFGDWLTREGALRDVLEIEPRQFAARNNLSRLLENVGRTREAIEMIETYAADFADQPFAAYRLAIMLWAAGRSRDSEAVIDRAMQRWPTNFAVWFTRYNLYVRTGRPERALEMSTRLPRPPEIPASSFAFSDLHARAVLTRAPADIRRAFSEGRRMAQLGAGYCENAINLAAQLGVNDEAFYLADGYYFGRGYPVAATRFAVEGQGFTPRYRRNTGFLFTPSAAAMRADPRFAALLEETGLASYWRRSGTRADVLA